MSARRLLRRLRRLIGWSLLAVVILAALAVALASRFLPVLEHHPEAVAHWLSEQVEAPVSVSGVEARWNRAGPLFSLVGLRIGQAPDVLDIERAQLQVNVYSGLWPGIPLIELKIDGPELELRRGADGRWRLDGFGQAAQRVADRSQLEQLERFGGIEVSAARLRVSDALTGRQGVLPRIDARMQRQGRRLRFGAFVHGDTPDARLRLTGELNATSQDGSFHLEGSAQDWAHWSQGMTLHGIALAEARGDLQVWVDIKDGTPTGLQVETALAPLVLQAAIERLDGSGRIEERSARFASWQLAFAALREGAEEWRLMLPDWRVTPDAGGVEIQVVRQGHATRDGSGLVRVAVDELQLEPLAALVPLAAAAPEGLRHWLHEASMHGLVREARVAWFDAARYRFDARVDDLGWSAVGGVPAIDGIGGQLDGDARAMRLVVQDGRWLAQAPGVLREPFTPQVSGELLFHDPGDGWRLDAPLLHLLEDDYDIVLAGGAQLLHEGGVLLDLRADVGDAPIVSAKRFWPVNVMPEPAVHWLDTALLDGRVKHGMALVRGKVSDWPFEHGEGRFEALAEIADTSVAYHDDWLPGHGVSGTARFINIAMELDLSGTVGAANVASARGGIADFGDSVLQLDIRGAGSGAALLDVMRRSPLHDTWGSTLEDLALGGRGNVSLDLRVPLEDHLGEPSVEGQVDIDRMDMKQSAWGLDFSAASGRVRFSDHGFSADELTVGVGEELGNLSIAAGGYTSSDEHLVEASLRGHFSAATLLGLNAASRWLEPWLSGDSDWNLQLTIPDTAEASARIPQLRVRSDLVGVAIGLPAPLRKGVTERMPFDLRLDLHLDPQDSGSDVDLRLGALLRLRGTLDEGFTGLALFGDAADAAAPAHGMHVAGQIPVLDAAAWAAVVPQADGGADGLDLVSADLFIGELNLLGRPFRETRVTFQRDATQLVLGFGGDALQGKVTVPLEDLAKKGVTAHFQRLYWPSLDEESLDHSTEDASAGSFSPAAIPPLHLESLDTRFADAHLGSVWLETWPVAQGMHVERLDTRSEAIDIKAKGDWLRVEGKEHSALTLDFSSRDAGSMLEALGFSRLLESGGAHGKLALGWPGAPGDFDWGRADGRLEFSVGQGRLLEVEPGAGRLFGLLNLTEIPRRLALDFSDFFKSGFAFNQMTGSFRIERGNAITDDFKSTAPSADILLRGRTGLKARDYDQTMEVQPKAGSMLPAIGALAGGPAGAAVGAVAQAVLRQPLKDMTRTVYRITGSWDEPRIEPLERGASQERPVTEAADPG